MWAGEGDTPTPELICAAAKAALDAGQTFYTYQRGIPPLREALAGYFSRLYERPMSPEEFFVTCGGMQAIQMAVQLVVGAGDEVGRPGAGLAQFRAARSPPRRRAAFRADAVRRQGLDARSGPPVRRRHRRARARLSSIRRPTRPAGPPALDELRAILDFARARGMWIIADEIYGRFYYEGGVAPSFQTLREPDDRIVFVQTFSKNWAMTGWRMGWLQAPARARPDHRESDPVQHLGRAELPAAGGRRRAQRGRGDRARADRAGGGRTADRVLGAGAVRQSALRLAGGRVLPAVRHRGRDQFAGDGDAAGRRGQYRPCARQSPSARRARAISASAISARPAKLTEAMARLTAWLEKRGGTMQ